MSVDLSSPDIANAYEQVRSKQLDWWVWYNARIFLRLTGHLCRLLLTYAQVCLLSPWQPRLWCSSVCPQTRDKLFLLASGDGGVEAMVDALPDNDIFYGFCREEERDRSYFVSAICSTQWF